MKIENCPTHDRDCAAIYLGDNSSIIHLHVSAVQFTIHVFFIFYSSDPPKEDEPAMTFPTNNVLDVELGELSSFLKWNLFICSISAYAHGYMMDDLYGTITSFPWKYMNPLLYMLYMEIEWQCMEAMWLHTRELYCLFCMYRICVHGSFVCMSSKLPAF